MIFTAGNILLIGSILLFVSIIVGKTGYRFGVPALLLFLVVGMLFGSDGLGLQFHNAKEAQFIGMVALSIILFSGGMDTKFTEIKPILTPGIVFVNCRSAAHGPLYRIIYLVAVRHELDQHPPAVDNLPFACIHHVIYRLSLCIRHSAFTKNEPEA